MSKHTDADVQRLVEAANDVVVRAPSSVRSVVGSLEWNLHKAVIPFLEPATDVRCWRPKTGPWDDGTDRLRWDGKTIWRVWSDGREPTESLCAMQNCDPMVQKGLWVECEDSPYVAPAAAPTPPARETASDFVYKRLIRHTSPQEYVWMIAEREAAADAELAKAREEIERLTGERDHEIEQYDNLCVKASELRQDKRKLESTISDLRAKLSASGGASSSETPKR